MKIVHETRTNYECQFIKVVFCQISREMHNEPILPVQLPNRHLPLGQWGRNSGHGEMWHRKQEKQPIKCFTSKQLVYEFVVFT